MKVTIVLSSPSVREMILDLIEYKQEHTNPVRNFLGEVGDGAENAKRYLAIEVQVLSN